jgi:anti-sigma regulatory factor (Ser/Thr protein kinase)
LIVVAEGSHQVLELTSGSMSNVAVARRFVRDALDGVVPAAVSADLQLAASELVTNALEHGTRQPVTVTISADRGRATLAIESSTGAAATFADVEDWAIAEPDQRAGRGLGIVRTIADDVEVERDGSTLRILVHRRL